MDKKYWYVIIGVVVVLAFLLIRSCQPTPAPAETPQVPTLAPASSATSTPKPTDHQYPCEAHHRADFRCQRDCETEADKYFPGAAKPDRNLCSDPGSYPAGHLGMGQPEN